MQIVYDKTTKQYRNDCSECGETCKNDYINELGMCPDCEDLFCELGDNNE